MTIGKERLVTATVKGSLWAYLSNYSGKILVFLSTIILARLLSTEAFGVAGYALVVISFLDVLADLGIGSALIYQRDAPKARETAFWLNLGAGFGLYFITLLLSPWVGAFFNDPRAIPVTQVLALTFPITAFGNIHDTILRKELGFKQKFIPDLLKALGKGFISICLALFGAGAWSLVIGQLAGTTIAVVAYWRVVPWRPTWQGDLHLMRSLLTYGLKIVSLNGLGVLLLNVDYLFVGRFLGASALGVYTLAFRIPELLIKQFCGILGRVMFPAYAKMRDDLKGLTQATLMTIRYVTLITVPMGLGLALLAKPIVLLLFTEKWINAISVIPPIAIYTLIRSLTFNIGDVYKARGRPGLLTGLSLVQVVMLLPALWWAVTIPATITAVAWVQVCLATFSGLINLVIAARLLNTSIFVLLSSFRPALIGGSVMSLAVAASLLLVVDMLPAFQLILGIGVGIVTYCGVIWLLQPQLIVQLKTAYARL